MITFTALSTITWGNHEDEYNPDLVIFRSDLIRELTMLEKTDGTATFVTDLIVERKFADVESATYYNTSISDYATQHNLALISTTVTSI